MLITQRGYLSLEESGMAFKMVCPKCGGPNFSIQQDKHFSAYKDRSFGLIFHCRCGRQLFGAQVSQEHDRQKKVFEADLEGRVQAEREREQALIAKQSKEDAFREAMAYRARYLAKKQEEAEAAEQRRREEKRLQWEEKVSRVAQEGDTEQVCAWKPCTNPVRPHSKYCSRTCSNKNARWRHKQRKRANRVAA